MGEDDLNSRNLDPLTVEGFGREWSTYDQTALTRSELQEIADAYFSIFPFDELPTSAEGFDLGCGSGRWAEFVAIRVGLLHCIDPSAQALDVARRRLADRKNVQFHLAASDSMPLAPSSQDFGYSLGVLHHIPDTSRALRDCVEKLKPGAPLLVYLYYSLENRAPWFRLLWRISDTLRRGICRLPFPVRRAVTTVIATLVYWPMARTARLVEKLGMDPLRLPLSSYRRSSFYTMRTDALDRFGTNLEQRFSRGEIAAMMHAAGLTDIRFREGPPFWVACGHRLT